MIRRIALENWRAYRALDVEVAPGTTFLVAPNGVGKSSLLEAVRWALAGGHVDHRSSMIRQGHRQATAAVTVDTPGGEMVVTRTLQAKGARLTAEATATLAGRTVPIEGALAVLEEAWAADARFVSRTAFLTEDLRRDAEEPNLRTHLCRAYSLDDLQRALAEIEPALTQVSRGLRASRSELTATADELRVSEAAAVAAVERLAAARAEVAAVRAAHAEVRASLEAARAQAAQAASASTWRERHQRLVAIATPLTGPLEPGGPPGRPLAEAVASLEARLAERVEAVREQQAALRARVEAAETALAALHDADAACPVCLRALDDESRGRAEELHRSTAHAAWDDLARLDEPAPTLAAELDAVRQLSRAVAALGAEPEVAAVATAASLDELAAIEAQALAAVEAAAAGLREAELVQQAAAARVEEVRTELATVDALTEQYRAEALLESAKAALNQTITTVLSRQLEPVAAEVNRRWEAVFPDRPNLHVMPDGQMSRMIDGAALEFGAFSAGEQTVAKLMMRLTTLLATTTVPFCWVDEPLEHLDPVSRQLVGSTLAHLSGPGGIEQIFVTTYEEPLVRRLAELQPDRVRVQYLRTEPVR